MFLNGFLEEQKRWNGYFFQMLAEKCPALGWGNRQGPGASRILGGGNSKCYLEGIGRLAFWISLR